MVAKTFKTLTDVISTTPLEYVAGLVDGKLSAQPAMAWLGSSTTLTLSTLGLGDDPVVVIDTDDDGNIRFPTLNAYLTLGDGGGFANDELTLVVNHTSGNTLSLQNTALGYSALTFKSAAGKERGAIGISSDLDPNLGVYIECSAPAGQGQCLPFRLYFTCADEPARSHMRFVCDVNGTWFYTETCKTIPPLKIRDDGLVTLNSQAAFGVEITDTRSTGFSALRFLYSGVQKLAIGHNNFDDIQYLDFTLLRLGGGILNLACGIRVEAQALSGTGALGAINLTSPTTTIVTTGAASATLAAGNAGQRKRIVMITDGGDCTVTVTNLLGGTTLVFGDAGDNIDLEYEGSKWYIFSNSGVTVS